MSTATNYAESSGKQYSIQVTSQNFRTPKPFPDSAKRYSFPTTSWCWQYQGFHAPESAGVLAWQNGTGITAFTHHLLTSGEASRIYHSTAADFGTTHHFQ